MLEAQTLLPVHVKDSDRAAHVTVFTPKGFSRKSVCFIILAALILNAAIVLVGLPKVSRPLTLTYSMDFGDLYNLIAKNLEEGKGYRVDANMAPTMLREPGYPLFLAAVFKLAGYGVQPARVACVFLALAAAVMLFLLTRIIGCDESVGVVAAALFLFYPGTLVAEARAGIEIPSIFTVLLFMLALHSALEKGSLWRYWAAGFLMGVAVLVRSQVLLFPLFLLMYLVFVAKNRNEPVKRAQQIAVLGLGTVIVLSPWVIRNYSLVHKFVPTATVAGIAAQEGLYACENASADEPFYVEQNEAGLERVQIAKQLGKPFIGPYYQLFYTPQDEVAFSQALLTHVSTEYRNHPRLLAKCAAKNLFFNFWFLGKTRLSTLLNMVAQTALLGLALAGVVVLLRRSLLRKASMILLFVLYTPVVQAVIIAHARHSMFIVPFLAALGAIFLVAVCRTLKEKTSIAPSPQTTVTRTRLLSGLG